MSRDGKETAASDAAADWVARLESPERSVRDLERFLMWLSCERENLYEFIRVMAIHDAMARACDDPALRGLAEEALRSMLVKKEKRREKLWLRA